MKLKLPLPRLPIRLGAFLARRGREESDDTDDTDSPRRGGPLPLPSAFLTVLLLTLGAILGVGLWLWLNAGQTLKERADAEPRIKVVVVGGAPPAATPPAPAPGGATDSGAPGKTAAPTAMPPVKTGDGKPPPPAGPGPEDIIPLAAAPAQGLTEDTRNGLLPTIAADGRQPWQVYARPFAATDKRGRIALVIGQLGVAGAATGLALQRLPPAVTLSFVPIADRLEGWVDAARGQGHEVMLSVPMEPLNYPHDDPGPNTLLLSLDAAHNVDRLEWALGRFAGYIGITSPSGSHFGADSTAMRPVIAELKKRGLMFLEAGTAPRAMGDALAKEMNVPRAHVDRIIDLDPSRGNIDAQLAALETIALEQGAAVGMGDPYPTTLERIVHWVPLLADKKLVLAPLSAVVNLQKPLPPPPPVEENH